MLTVSQLAKQFNLSRATILYYEREKLLLPSLRSENGYRWYDEKAVKRLAQIIDYRNYGLPVKQISQLLSTPTPSSQFDMLTEHLHKLGDEINELRAQQKAIIATLQEPNVLAGRNIDKAKWVSFLQVSGFNDAAMIEWHRTYEQLDPNKHSAFLRSLGIEQSEIERIKKL